MIIDNLLEASPEQAQADFERLQELQRNASYHLDNVARNRAQAKQSELETNAINAIGNAENVTGMLKAKEAARDEVIENLISQTETVVNLIYECNAFRQKTWEIVRNACHWALLSEGKSNDEIRFLLDGMTEDFLKLRGIKNQYDGPLSKIGNFVVAMLGNFSHWV